ncbi:hypothetical protein TNCV_4707591 [Trichonephila clavipes]|nr:hypothetical protein TNCV_4707591 [Trichonephila clavipes]
MEQQHVFRLRYETTSMPHIPGGGLDVLDLLLGSHASEISNSWIFSSGTHPKFLAYEALLDTVEDFTAWFVIASVDIDRTPDSLERIQLFFVRQDCMFYGLSSRNFEIHLWQSLVVAFLTSSCGIYCL